MRASRQAPLLDAEEERALLLAARRGEARAVERLVVAHLRIVHALVPSFRRPGVLDDDLVSEGVLGLMEAVERFDCERDNRFASYARWWVQARLLRFATSARHVVAPPSTRVARRLMRGYGRAVRSESHRLGRAPTREELARALGVTEDDVAATEPVLAPYVSSLTSSADGAQVDVAHDQESPEETLARRSEASACAQRAEAALALLSPREQRVLLERFAKDDPASLAALSSELAVSRERVRQIQERAREKIRAKLAPAEAFV